MTLIEMVVALAVIAILLIPVAGIFYTGQKTDAENRQYGDAIALGDAALAKADAVSYGSLGYYEDQFGSCGTAIPGYNLQVGVDLGCHPSPSGAPEPVTYQDTSLQVASIHFTLTTYVVWANGSGTCPAVSGPCLQAYKQVYAVVTWHDGGKAMTTTQNVLVYPGGLGRYSGQGSQGSSQTVSPPPNVTITSDTYSSSSATITWGDPGAPEPGFYEVVIQNSTSHPATGGSGTDQSWDPTGATLLGSTSGLTFQLDVQPSTYYSVVVVAFSSDGSQWAVSSNAAQFTTPSGAPPPCQLTSLIVNQTGQPQIDTLTVKNGNGGSHGHLEAAVSITVGFTGTCTGTNNVVVSATGPANLGPYTLTYSASPAQFTYNPPTGLCPASAFATGSYVFSVALDGTNQSPTANVAVSSTGGSPAC